MPDPAIIGLTLRWGQKINHMQQNIDSQLFRDILYTPLQAAVHRSKCQRLCRELPDQQWLQMGIERALGQHRSGRSFLQHWAMTADYPAVQVTAFFATLKSRRRLSLVEEINAHVAHNMPAHPHSQIDSLEDLSGIDVYAGDGHYHEASTHEKPIKGKRRAVGHFYTLNYRIRAMTHLTAADLQDGRKKKEHDLSALKRFDAAQLRQGAGIGRQVLYVWDRAVIDFRFWDKCKQTCGVYFLTRTKESLKITQYGSLDFDPEDPVNAGVLKDQLASSETSGKTFRYIEYQCPVSGTIYAFITNHMQVRPGVLAWLYLRRWDIEKTYDTFKNKLDETKAWASSQTSKSVQAQFLCLAHNLTVILETTVGVEDVKETQRRHKRDKAARANCEKQGRAFSSLLFQNPSERSQLCLKFIRWLRHQLSANQLIATAIASLKVIYAQL